MPADPEPPPASGSPESTACAQPAWRLTVLLNNALHQQELAGELAVEMPMELPEKLPKEFPSELPAASTNEVPEATVNTGFVKRFCTAGLATQELLALDDADELELSVQLLDLTSIQALNLQYRGKDAPTNVLSFASDMPAMPDGQLRVLGDLVLCQAVVEREAKEQGKPVLDHWAHMLVHGTLHLCGYDHEDPEQARAMERLEIQILSQAGIPDPYQEVPTASVNNPIVKDHE